MAIPVVQLGTGNVGVHALRALITNPEFELTGVWVSSEAKAGKDAAELAGLADSTGVLASTDLDAVLATGPKCAVYNAMADNRLPEALEDYRRVLAAGINIVGSGPVFLQYPWQDPRGAQQTDRRRCTRRKFEPLRQRHRSGLRERPVAAGAGRHLPEHPAGAVHGDRRLRHL